MSGSGIEEHLECVHASNTVGHMLSGKVGSITSRCSGKEPALLPRTHGWTRELGIVNFDQ